MQGLILGRREGEKENAGRTATTARVSECCPDVEYFFRDFKNSRENIGARRLG
jgi:hypothetical protein